jgi:putative pyruvate formate lyase activating enzyme
MEFIAEEISPETYVNLMDQYRPAYLASSYPAINRPLTGAEYKDAIRLARQAGLHRFDHS